MPSEPERIYWDSCLYISMIQETQGRIDVLREIHRQAEKGQIVFVASALVIAEVCKINKSTATTDEQAKKIREYFENPFIKVRVVDRKTAEDAAQICRQFPAINPPDAIHLATAIRARCSVFPVFQTYDGEKGGPEKLLAHDGKIGTPSLAIKLPAAIVRGEQQSFL